MEVFFLLLVQVVTPATSSPSSGPAEPGQRAVVHGTCADLAQDDGDVVVCGRVDHGEQYRLKPLTHRYDPVPGPGIGVKVGAGRANLYSTSQVSPDGKPDKRIMVTLKLPF